MFRKEIQEAIDAITVGLPKESVLDRSERIVGELIDVGGRLVKTFDETNRDEDLQSLKDELEAATVIIVNKVMVGRPVIAKGLKVGLPFVIEAGIDYVADGAGTAVDFCQRHVAPQFARLRRIGERGEAAFSVEL